MSFGCLIVLNNEKKIGEGKSDFSVASVKKLRFRVCKFSFIQAGALLRSNVPRKNYSKNCRVYFFER